MYSQGDTRGSPFLSSVEIPVNVTQLDKKEISLENANVAHLAVVNNDLELLKRVILNAPSLLSKTDTKFGLTPASLAAMLNRAGALELIIQANKDSLLIPNKQESNAVSLTAVWSKYGNESIDSIVKEVPEFLIRENKNGKTAISDLQQNNPKYLPKIVSDLCKVCNIGSTLASLKMPVTAIKPNNEVLTCENANIAHLAVINDDIELLQKVMKEAPDLISQQETKEGLTPAALALMFNRVDALELIIQTNKESFSTQLKNQQNAVTFGVEWSRYGKESINRIAKLAPELLILADGLFYTAIFKLSYLDPQYLIQLIKNIIDMQNNALTPDSIKLQFTVKKPNDEEYSLSKANIAHLAIAKNDIELLNKIMEKVPDLLTKPDQSGLMPAALAVMLNRVDALELIIQANKESLLLASSNKYNAVSLAAHWSNFQPESINLIARCVPAYLGVADEAGRTGLSELAEKNPNLLPQIKLTKIIKENQSAGIGELKIIEMPMTVKLSRSKDLTLDGANIAHLAVITDDMDLLQQIIEEAPELVIKPDKSGLPPISLAIMLYKTKAIDLIVRLTPDLLLEINAEDTTALSELVDKIKTFKNKSMELRRLINSISDASAKQKILEYLKRHYFREWYELVTATEPDKYKKMEILGRELEFYVQIFELEDIFGLLDTLSRYESQRMAAETVLMRRIRELAYREPNDSRQIQIVKKLQSSLDFGSPPVADLKSNLATTIISETERIAKQGRSHCREFPSFIYDTIAYRDGLPPLMIRIANAISKNGVEFIPASDSNHFPGRGFCINGLSLDKVFPSSEIEFAAVTKRWEEFFPEEDLPKLLGELEDSKIFFTRGAGIIMPPDTARFYLPGHDLDNLVHYSYVYINDNFPNGDLDDFFLVPTSTLKKIIPMKFSYSQDYDSDNDVNKVPLSIQELQKLVEVEGIHILNIGSLACFNAGLQNSFPAESSPFFNFEKDSIAAREKTGGHLKLPMSSLDTTSRDLIYTQLQQAHRWVAKVSRRLQYLKTLFNLIYSSAQKGLCGPELQETQDTSLTMLIESIELYKWLKQGGSKQKQLIEQYGYPLLCIASAHDYSAMPDLSLGYIDTEDLTIRDGQGQVIIQLNTELDSDTIIKFQDLFQKATSDKWGLRFLPRSLLRIKNNGGE